MKSCEILLNFMKSCEILLIYEIQQISVQIWWTSGGFQIMENLFGFTTDFTADFIIDFTVNFMLTPPYFIIGFMTNFITSTRVALKLTRLHEIHSISQDFTEINRISLWISLRIPFLWNL